MVFQLLKNLKQIKEYKSPSQFLSPCQQEQKGVLQNVILELLLLYLKSQYITVIKLLHDLIEIL